VFNYVIKFWYDSNRMKSVVFFGPTLLSGIGQVTYTLSKLVYADYVSFGQSTDTKYDVGFCFIIPVPQMIQMMKVYSKLCSRMIYMTVCETETVHDMYSQLFELSDTFYTPSHYASTILKRQFPSGNFPVLHHYACPNVSSFKRLDIKADYVFYHIGNVIDPRKNIKKIIEAFMRLDRPNAVLLLKATCNQPVPWKVPGVVVVEGLLSQEELEGVHATGDCYVSFSHSEGAGMGAIEAAMRNKPVIIPEYGAGKEYIDTPYLIPCSRTKVGHHDFLYEPDMEWGDPDFDSLLQYMREAYDAKHRFQHSRSTHEIMSKVPGRLNKVLLGQEY
jgi:glycosyltransferase involved in cell wall biosynthesis